MSFDRKRDAELYYEKAVELHKEHKKNQAIEFIEKSIKINQEIDSRNFSYICLFIGFYTLLGLFLIGVFPMNDIGVSNDGHIIGAQIYWSGALTFWGLLTILVNKNPNSTRKARIVVLLTFISWLLFLTLFLPPMLFSHVDIRLPIIFQWIAHFFIILSIFFLSINLIKN